MFGAEKTGGLYTHIGQVP